MIKYEVLRDPTKNTYKYVFYMHVKHTMQTVRKLLQTGVSPAFARKSDLLRSATKFIFNNTDSLKFCDANHTLEGLTAPLFVFLRSQCNMICSYVTKISQAMCAAIFVI